MRTIAIVNQKGGVGKTVTAIHLADTLAREYHKRVLLVDADSQHNATDFFGADGCLSAVLTGAGGYYPDNIQHTDVEGLDILGGDDDLMYLDITAMSQKRVRQDAMRELFSCIAEDEVYDFIIVDCPPAFNAASTAALVAVDEVVIPMKLDAFSVSGMRNIMHQVNGLHGINPRLRVAGVLLTMSNLTNRDKEQELREVCQGKIPVFTITIPESDRVNGMTYSGTALSIYSPRSGARVGYRRWVKEYLGGGGHG